MPELPEVETVVRGLSRHIVGQKVKDIKILSAKSFTPAAPAKRQSLRGAQVQGIIRRGKGIIINLSGGKSLLIHLKMTGQLIYISGSPIKSGMTKKESHHPGIVQDRIKDSGVVPPQNDGHKGRLNFGHPTDDFTNTMPSKHTRVIFELTPPRSPANPLTRFSNFLYFNDQRRFGWVKLVATKDAPKDKFFAGLGMEPFDKKFTPAFLYAAIQRRPKSNIKAIILDQSLVTGIGNIYSDEALFYARLKPTRLGKSITKPDTTRLVSAIKKVLTKGIKYLGTSVNTHRTPEGSMGRMQNYLAVYDRKGLPCVNPERSRGGRGCKGKVQKIRLNGRGTHFCPKCQK